MDDDTLPTWAEDKILDLEIELSRLRAGIQRIADGYGGDVASYAKNLLEGKI